MDLLNKTIHARYKARQNQAKLKPIIIEREDTLCVCVCVCGGGGGEPDKRTPFQLLTELCVTELKKEQLLPYFPDYNLHPRVFITKRNKS